MSDLSAGPEPAVPADDPRCRVCHRAPATPVSFHAYQGVRVRPRTAEYPGPWCRVCGLAIFRMAMARTLARGWESVMFPVLVWVALARNLLAHRSLVRLGLPQDGPAPQDGSAPRENGPAAPLDPGKPLHRRPVALGLIAPLLGAVIPLGVLVDIGYRMVSGPASLTGTCAMVGDDRRVNLVGCGSRHNARIIRSETGESDCPPGTEWTIARRFRTWCLIPD